MAELDDAHAEVRRLRAELAAARAEALAAAERVARLRARRAGLVRTGDPRDPTTDERLAELDEQIGDAVLDATSAREKVAEVAQEYAQAVTAFGALADPTVHAANLAGDTPVLLLPVRLETRFIGNELLVRVYPDAWAVDAFEERLSAVEVDSACRFWTAWWRAGGDEARRRGAWRGLVGSHGSGRGEWIVEHHRPVDPDAEPVRAADDEVILVVVDPAPADRTAVAEYWVAVHAAGADAAAVTAAGDALVAQVGEQLAREVTDRPPVNLDEQGAPVSVAFLELPAVPEADTKLTSWTRPATARVLPDCFVLLGFRAGNQVLMEVGAPVPPDLVVGPDPSAAAEGRLRVENGELVVPDELQWMIDFDRAVDTGMGFRVTLDLANSQGFDRLFVLGMRVGATPEQSESELAELLTRHHHSRTGLALVPQGTPTNNTEQAGAGFDRADDADASYDLVFGIAPALKHHDDWLRKQDGQWLAETLGFAPEVLATVPGATGEDQAEARAANTALWPATWGYFLETMMHPVLQEATFDAAREFFTGYVSGRGLVPAVRIGRQPYGILPTTVFSRLEPAEVFQDRLHTLLQKITEDWRPLAEAVPRVGGPVADPHQTLLDVLGLHPASVELHQRYAESVEDLYNRLCFDGFGANLYVLVQTLVGIAEARQLLQKVHPGAEDPAILEKLFHGTQYQLTGPLVDDRPLSELDPVRVYADNDRNYLRWLVDAALKSLDDVRRQLGFTDDKPPTALLYLLLRHAILQAWWDAGLRLRREAEALDDADVHKARREAPFVHIAPGHGIGDSESRYQGLYLTDRRVTGNPTMTIAEAVLQRVGDPKEESTRYLTAVLGAVGRLADVPTARLERVLVEHLDCATYRLDAWRLGLVHHKLLDLRLSGGAAKRGVHLGAYGWLQDVRPEPHQLQPVQLSGKLAQIFADPADPPPMRDTASGGFVHAPSLDHAATAAVLRSGYLANATPAQPDLMAVDISSERMRLAMSLVQGVRHGQPLGALLGYRMERGLHDRHTLVEVDSVIHELRHAFPAPGDPDGRQAIDGQALVTHIQETGQKTYPFGRADLPAISDEQNDAVNLEVELLLDTHDALADLALAEGVHQAVLGNFDRVASTMDAYGAGAVPPEPAVLETPRSGTVLTHRFGLHLRTGLDHGTSPVAEVPEMTPRATAEPGVNELLGRTLPPFDEVAVRVTWTRRDGTSHEHVLSLNELGLQPLDVLHLWQPGTQAMTELDERIGWLVESQEGLAPDEAATVVIRYTERIPGRPTLFELTPLLTALRTLVTRSRPLRATDVVPHNQADKAVDVATPRAERARPAAVLSTMEQLSTDAADLVTALTELIAGPAQARAPQLAAMIDATVGVLHRASTFGFPATGWGAVTERRLALFTGPLDRIDEMVARWLRRRDEAAAHLATDDTLPSTATSEERNRVLLLAEQAISTVRTEPIPEDADAYRTIVTAKQTAFLDRLAALQAIRPAATGVGGVLAAIDAVLPLTEFDPVPLDRQAMHDEVLGLLEFLRDRVTALMSTTDSRMTAAAGHLATHDAAVEGQPSVDALVAATKALLGEDAVVVPEVVLPPAIADEWHAAMAWSRSGQLTAHLTGPLPVDDWLHGVARVREKVHAWEQAALLAGVFGRPEPALRPIQLPHASEPWLALELPPGTTAAGERILYTAHYPAVFDKTEPVCGLLVDEWTETIPGEAETTGLAFHHDSPDCEAPQAMLLAVPPGKGQPSWQWQDLVDTLHETLDMAALRAVEPERIDDTPYATYLPATVMAATVNGISIAVNLALNNGLSQALGGQ